MPLRLQEVEVPRIPTKSGHEGGKVASLTPMGYPWYSFILWDDLAPGAMCDRKEYVNEKSR